MRAELLALSVESLAELTNRGLVKRAAREVERAAPVLTENEEGTVRGTFADGVVTELPAGGLDAGRCRCGATGMCRHIVAVVLAYKAAFGSEVGVGTGVTPDVFPDKGKEVTPGGAPVGGSGNGPDGEPGSEPGGEPGRGAGSELDPEPAKPDEDGTPEDEALGPAETSRPPGEETLGDPSDRARNIWSPGTFTDAELEEHIGGRAMAVARRTREAGYVAQVRRAGTDRPVPVVDLPAATVRFHVPGDLAYARSDARAGTRDDLLALAVWAFRVADEQAPGADDVHVQVGGAAAPHGGTALEQAVALAGTVLREGAVHLENGLGTRTATVRAALERARLRWPLLALNDLEAQLQAYQNRSARYRSEDLADHVAELFARHRAVTNGGAGLRSRVLGTDEATQTQLRQARLDGLGARVSAFGEHSGERSGEQRTVEVYLAHADSGSVLVLRKTYETGDAGSELAARRVAGTTIRRLATSSVITASAHRSASRTVRIGTGGLSRTHALAVSRPWQDLPASIAAPSLDVLAQQLAGSPPRAVRARVEAELVRVIPIADVEALSYSPGDQRLDAVVVDPAGTSALISATHETCAPGRLDAMAAALNADPQQVSGTVRRRGGQIIIDPIAFAAEDRLIVPDLTPADHSTTPALTAVGEHDVLNQALDNASALLAEITHRGMHHVPAGMAGRLQAAAGDLGQVGLHRAAADIRHLATALGPDPGKEAVDSWVNAYLRISLASDLS